MNARQKEKRYKQKYEQLKNTYMKPLFEVRYKVDCLHFTKTYPTKYIIDGGSEFMDLIRKDLVEGLTTQLNDYVEIMAQEDPFMDTTRFDVEIKAVNPNANYY